MIYSYHSGFAEDIEKMLEWRGVLGYEKNAYAGYLKSFDTFCHQKFPDVDVLTCDIALTYFSTFREGRDFRVYVTALRNLAKYQIMIGKKASVIPASYFKHGNRPIPHIMCDEECRNFFLATDNYPRDQRNPLLEYTVPVIFRLQYATGMRPKEVRELSRVDFDFTHDTIYIADSKNHKDRRIAVEHKIMVMCMNYDRIAREIYPDTEIFFPNRLKKEHSANSLSNLFHKCWKLAGNTEVSGYCSPYMLRHNFATQTLMRWIEEGKDISQYIPYLSSYMGHETFRDTYYYIHLLPGRLAKMEYMDISDIVPEVLYER